MSEVNEILLNTINQQFEQARNIENQRSTLTNFNITIAGAIQAVIIQRGYDDRSVVLALVIAAIGAYGIILTLKLYERFELHITRIRELEIRLDELNSSARLRETLTKAKRKHEAEYSQLSKIRLSFLWRLIHLAITIVGIANFIWIVSV